MSELKTIKKPCLLLLFFLIPINHARSGKPVQEDDNWLQLADVSIHEKATENSKSKYKTKTKPKVIPQKAGQYEIEGYMDQKYVRVVLEVEKKGRIVGNIYDRSGKGIYVHGEYQEGALYVYDDEGTEYTIVVE